MSVYLMLRLIIVTVILSSSGADLDTRGLGHCELGHGLCARAILSTAAASVVRPRSGHGADLQGAASGVVWMEGTFWSLVKKRFAM